MKEWCPSVAKGSFQEVKGLRTAGGYPVVVSSVAVMAAAGTLHCQRSFRAVVARAVWCGHPADTGTSPDVSVPFTHPGSKQPPQSPADGSKAHSC